MRNKWKLLLILGALLFCCHSYASLTIVVPEYNTKTNFYESGTLNNTGTIGYGYTGNMPLFGYFNPVVSTSGDRYYASSAFGVFDININTGIPEEITNGSGNSYENVYSILLHPDNKHLYIVTYDSNIDSSEIILVDTTTRQESTRISSLGKAISIGLSDDKNTLYSLQYKPADGKLLLSKRNSLSLGLQDEQLLQFNVGASYVPTAEHQNLVVNSDIIYVTTNSHYLRTINPSTYEVSPEFAPSDISNYYQASRISVIEDKVFAIYTHYNNGGFSLIAFNKNSHEVLSIKDFINYRGSYIAYDAISRQLLFRGAYATGSSLDGRMIAIDIDSYEVVKEISNLYAAPSGLAIQPADSTPQEELSLSTQRINAAIVLCQNDTTGQAVYAAITQGSNAWNCEQSGLVVNPGDTVTVGVQGIVKP